MKAVIMAGGEGSRLRPLSLGRPKPMVPLLDRPVMEHIITLLRRCGITDICVTLQYLPGAIMDYFGDGGPWGVHLHYFVEEQPLGTAGSVKNCMGHLGEDDFLVISGDAVCDLDLTEAIAFHRTRRSLATLLLYRHPTPLEYGLVLTDDEGRIQRFLEKPAWGQVISNTVNTGIYLLTHQAMDRVPEGRPFDFGKELFPLLLDQGVPLYGHVAEGYWCDMGDPAAYLQCVADALSGQVELNLALPRTAPGIWSASPIPQGVTLVPPCWIGPQVSLGEGSLIGPHVALGAGSSVGTHSLIQRSALHQAQVGDRCTLYGAILCRDSSVQNNAVLNEGTVLGEQAQVQEGAILTEGVKLWPGRIAPREGKLTYSLTAAGGWSPLRFGDGGVIRGVINQDLCPETLLTLGGTLGLEGKVGLGWSGGNGATALARSLGSGIATAGGQVLSHDGGTPAAAAWLAQYYELPLSLFLEQEGEKLYLSFFDRNGLPLDRSRQRKLEGALLRGETAHVTAGRVGSWEQLTGIPRAYAADGRRARLVRPLPRPVTVSIPGQTAADRTMAAALEEAGCRVLLHAESGVPAFFAQRGGLYLQAADESGRTLSPQQLLVLLCLIELEQGEGAMAVPAAAPAVIDQLAAEWRGRALRLGRDGEEALELYRRQPWMRDALFAAIRICSRMSLTGSTLEELAARLPHFVLQSREIPLTGDRGELMQALAQEGALPQPGEEGIHISSDQGWVYLVPLVRRPSLRVIAQGYTAETAQALCDFYAKKISTLDQQVKNNGILSP